MGTAPRMAGWGRPEEPPPQKQAILRYRDVTGGLANQINGYISCTGIPNYNSLTKNNFAILNAQIMHTSSTEVDAEAVGISSYNAATGQLGITGRANGTSEYVTIGAVTVRAYWAELE